MTIKMLFVPIRHNILVLWPRFFSDSRKAFDNHSDDFFKKDFIYLSERKTNRERFLTLGNKGSLEGRCVGG